MGLEAELKKELRMTKVRLAVLNSVKLAGILTLTLMAPNVLQILGKSHQSSRRSVLSVAARLEKKGLLIRDGYSYRLTKLGEKYINQTQLSPKNHRWDKKWRIVIFDIPERRRTLRNALRLRLQELGFKMVQNSVWVFPYDCEELIALLKANYRLGKEVVYLIVDKFENDAHLRRAFKLA